MAIYVYMYVYMSICLHGCTCRSTTTILDESSFSKDTPPQSNNVLPPTNVRVCPNRGGSREGGTGGTTEGSVGGRGRRGGREG